MQCRRLLIAAASAQVLTRAADLQEQGFCFAVPASLLAYSCQDMLVRCCSLLGVHIFRVEIEIQLVSSQKQALRFLDVPL